MTVLLYIAECVGLLLLENIAYRGLESWVSRKEGELAQRKTRKLLGGTYDDR